MYGKGFKGATANDNVEWKDHVLPLLQNYPFWQYPNQVSMLPCLKVVFTKAHILRLYGGAQRTELKVVTAFQNLKRQYWSILGLRVPGFLCGVSHKNWQEYRRPIFMEKGKRIQEYDNRADLTNAPRKASLKEKQPNRYYQVGMRFRKRTFLSNSR